jgi:hypothetical protein
LIESTGYRPHPGYDTSLAQTRFWRKMLPAPAADVKTKLLKVTRRVVHGSDYSEVVSPPVAEIIEVIIPAGASTSTPFDALPDFTETLGDFESETVEIDLFPIDIPVVFGIGPSAPAVNGVPGTSRHFLESYLESVKVSRAGDIWLVKGEDASGTEKLYCIEVAATEEKLLAALRTAGMTIVFDGHANFGIGPNFSMSTLKSIGDFTNFGARSHAAILRDFRGNGQEPDAMPYLGPNALPLPDNPQTPQEIALIVSWGNLHQDGWAYLVPAAQDGVMGDVENHSVPFMNLSRSENDQNKGPGDTIVKQGQGFNNEWHFTHTSEEVADTYLIVKAPKTDVPTLRYSTFFYNACSTGAHFIANFKHGKCFYTKRTCTIDRGSGSSLKSLVRGKTPEEATAILDGEDNVDGQPNRITAHPQNLWAFLGSGRSPN